MRARGASHSLCCLGVASGKPRRAGWSTPNVLVYHNDMKHATKHTFSGMGSSGVEFFSSGHRDHAEVTFRDTESGDSVVIEGLRTVYLQGAIRNYVRSLGYRDEDKNAREFLETLQGELAKALKKEEA